MEIESGIEFDIESPGLAYPMGVVRTSICSIAFDQLYQGPEAMTLLGRVIMFANLLLSIAFFVVALVVNATHINWKAMSEDTTKKLSVTEQVNEQLRTELTKSQTERAKEQSARKSALAALQTQLDQTLDDLAKKNKQLSDLQAAHTELTQTERSTQENLARLTKDVDQLRQQIVASRKDRDEQFTKVVQLTDNLSQMQSELQGLNERSEQLTSQVTLYKSQLDILGVNPNVPLDQAPQVRGIITAIGKDGLVELSLGSDDGLREGLTLEVTRGSQYLGRIKVRQVDADKAIGEVLDGYRKGRIQEGDRVDSKLG